MVWLQSKMMRNSRPRFISLSRGRESSESRGSWRIFRRMLYLDGAMMSSCSRMSPERPQDTKDTRVHTCVPSYRHLQTHAHTYTCTHRSADRHGYRRVAHGDLCTDTETHVQTQALAHSGTDVCTQLYTPARAHMCVYIHMFTHTRMLIQEGHTLGLINTCVHT